MVPYANLKRQMASVTCVVTVTISALIYCDRPAAAQGCQPGWNGALGQPGLGGGGTDCNPVLFVTSSAVYADQLILGGNFISIGGQTVNCVSRRVGPSWQPLGAGMNCQVEALAVYNGELIAGASSAPQAAQARTGSRAGTMLPGKRSGAESAGQPAMAVNLQCTLSPCMTGT